MIRYSAWEYFTFFFTIILGYSHFILYDVLVFIYVWNLSSLTQKYVFVAAFDKSIYTQILTEKYHAVIMKLKLSNMS